ncbi:8-oxoguanine DNA glycosylase OGG fold protein [Streptomyces sp. NBC_00151]|uniref:8-oxoguanine DNA glycosylase OGG fold protein n=1 Tax=Streptomyces sp. NBC_00151 TaxID=2975669 RepID=UPI003FA3A656
MPRLRPSHLTPPDRHFRSHPTTSKIILLGVLKGQVPGLGPAFFTKFLYFTGIARPPAHGAQPLILDQVLSRRLRWMAAAVGRESGHDVDGSIAAWVWSDSNWTPHRYQVYLSFMHAAGDSWPSGAAPDLLECALFTTDWETSG